MSIARSSSSVLARITNISLIARGYAASAKQVAEKTGLGEGGSSVNTVGKEEMKQGSVSPSSSWGPDPVTGYYKPSDQVTEVDAVDQRESHHKILNHD